jgi:hypothetical protein
MRSTPPRYSNVAAADPAPSGTQPRSGAVSRCTPDRPAYRRTFCTTLGAEIRLGPEGGV